MSMSDEEVDRLLNKVDLEQQEPGPNNNIICHTNVLPVSQVPLLDAIGSSTDEPLDRPSRALEEGGHGELRTEMGPSPDPNLDSLPTVILYMSSSYFGYGRTWPTS